MPAYHSWDYYVLDIDLDDEDLEDQLRELGKEGWESSLCFQNGDSGVIILKKPTDGIETYTGSHIRKKRPERKPREPDNV